MRLSVKGALIGIACGALLGFFYCWATDERGPTDDVRAAEKLRGAVGMAGMVAVLGGVAGGVLRASGWAMLAGSLLGALVVGVFGVVVTLHLKGLIYSFLGAPIGAVFVYLYGVSHDVAKPSDKEPAPAASAGVWDSELDR
jgi:hypothetical protein